MAQNEPLVYKIPSSADILLHGDVRKYGYFLKEVSAYKYYSVEFDRDHHALSFTDYDTDMNVSRVQSYYKYGLYGDEIMFYPPDDVITESETTIIRKGSFGEIIYTLDNAKRITRLQTSYPEDGKLILHQEVEYGYSTPVNVKSFAFKNYNGISYSKTINHRRKECFIIEREYDDLGRCTRLREVPVNFDEKDKGSFASLITKPEVMAGEIYVYENDTVAVYTVTFSLDEAAGNYTYKLYQKILTDLDGRIIHKGDCDTEGNFNGSNSKTFYDETGRISRVEMYRNGSRRYTQKYEYDEKGNVVFFDSTEKEKIKYEYEFDEHGNWISRTDFVNGKQVGSVRREISYY